MQNTSPQNSLNSYLRAAPWPHLSAFFSLLSFLTLTWLAARLPEWGYAEGSWLALGGAVGMLISAGLCQAEAWARWQDYCRVRKLFQRHGWRPLFVAPLCRSRCQCDAVLLAAHETGFGEKTRAWFKDKGYRWYHLASDRVMNNPRMLVNAGFLKATFMPPMWNSRRGRQVP